MPKKIKGFSFKPFSQKQLRLMYWYMVGSPHRGCDMVIADGAIRSGKTVAMICGFLRWSLATFDGETFILAGKTVGALKRNVIGPALEILRAWGSRIPTSAPGMRPGWRSAITRIISMMHTMSGARTGYRA